MNENKKYMRLALNQAKKAFNAGEVPIGAVIVYNGKVIARAFNQRNGKKMATAHAEILAIEKACKKIGDWRLDGAEMYVTLEPCPMCAGAIANARISKVYFGAYERKSGAVLSNFRILFSSGLNHEAEAEGGILHDECANLLKIFFENKRKGEK
ncbi:MAG: tRNA adenosine(34) deaminase TadA [Clostridia bacterium]|nr:tRNA adenosine(34) deaminase TadA [Clostridia bacterium]